MENGKSITKLGTSIQEKMNRMYYDLFIKSEYKLPEFTEEEIEFLKNSIYEQVGEINNGRKGKN